MSTRVVPPGWSPDSWQDRSSAQAIRYPDPDALAAVVGKLRSLPPLVTSWEVEKLKGLLAEAQEGRQFLLQGGDCAETLADCRPDVIANKLKILLQMSLVLIHGGKRPVIRVGRFAGQYAKPRSSPTERRDDRELPSYFGDLLNRSEYDAGARQIDPQLLLAGYSHAALTLNFIRSLSAAGFADLHHPEYWELALPRADLSPELRAQVERAVRDVREAIHFLGAIGEGNLEQLTRVDFFTSHEGLNLVYEAAQTRPVPRREGHYDLTTHLPWIGERTRALDGAHVEFFRGVRNPVGVKLGPGADPAEVLALIERLNPADEPGKLVLIVRMGAQRVASRLPPLVDAVRAAGRRVLWVCDPMHGNTQVTASGVKTRDFEQILSELEQTFDVFRQLGAHLGGVHFELTGDDVTECVGGGVTEADLELNYASACDPRLNYRQALEMAFRMAGRMAAGA